MFVVLDATAGGEVVRTDDAVVGEDDAACCHAEVCSVIGYRAAHTPNQTTYRPTNVQSRARKVHQTTQAITVNHPSVLWFTFRDGRAVGVGDETGETDVDGAAEASVHRCGRGEVGDTLAVIKLPTHRNHTAPHVLTALFTYKAGVDAWGEFFFF